MFAVRCHGRGGQGVVTAAELLAAAAFLLYMSEAVYNAAGLGLPVIPGQDEVDAFLPPYQPRQVLDPLDPGSGGIVTAELRTALAGEDGRPFPAGNPVISTVIAGLGGRPVTRKSLRPVLTSALHGVLPPFSFLDLRTELAEAELARMRATRRSGPSAENLLRDLSVTAPGVQG